MWLQAWMWELVRWEIHWVVVLNAVTEEKKEKRLVVMNAVTEEERRRLVVMNAVTGVDFDNWSSWMPWPELLARLKNGVEVADPEFLPRRFWRIADQAIKMGTVWGKQRWGSSRLLFGKPVRHVESDREESIRRESIGSRPKREELLQQLRNPVVGRLEAFQLQATLGS
jgi:hypothetical protein